MNWEEFRNNVAKEVLCAMVSQCYDKTKVKKQAALAVEYANELTRSLYLNDKDQLNASIVQEGEQWRKWSLNSMDRVTVL